MKMPWDIRAPNFSKFATPRAAEGLCCAKHPNGNRMPFLFMSSLVGCNVVAHDVRDVAQKAIAPRRLRPPTMWHAGLQQDGTGAFEHFAYRAFGHSVCLWPIRCGCVVSPPECSRSCNQFWRIVGVKTLYLFTVSNEILKCLKSILNGFAGTGVAVKPL